MKEKVEKIVMIIISVITIFLGSIFVLKGPVKFSEYENRYLQQFPIFSVTNLINGRFVGDLEDYINDQFPLRNTLVGLKTQFDVILGKTKVNDIYVAKDNYLIPAYIKTNQTSQIINTLNSFVKNNTIPIKLLLAPNAIQIYEDKLPINDEISNGISDIKEIYNNFNGISINIVDKFLINKDKYDLYYKTDHHWTTYGAFIAYNQYLESLGLFNKSLHDYNLKKVTDEFYGTSYSKSNYYNVIPDSIYIFEDNTDYLVDYVVEKTQENTLYNYDYLNKKDKYSIFLDNNHALIEVDNLDNNSNRNLLLIKNSYGNSFAPFIVNDYDKTSIIDLRYFNESVSDYIEINNITDVLILYDINGIYTDSSIFKLK